MAKIQAGGTTEKTNPAYRFPVTVDRQGVDTDGRGKRRGGGNDRYHGHSPGYTHVCQTQSKGRDAEGRDGTEQRQRKANPECLPGRDAGRRRQ